MYIGKTEPALVSVSDSYSEDEEISVSDSRPSASPAYTITDYLSTDYCPKEMYAILTQEGRSTLSRVLRTPTIPLRRQVTRGLVAQG